MRYLTRQLAIGALRRGKVIEEFVGGAEFDGEAAVRRVAISPVNSQYRISLPTVQDPDAVPDRWVNDAVAGEEYVESVKKRRTPAGRESRSA